VERLVWIEVVLCVRDMLLQTCKSKHQAISGVLCWSCCLALSSLQSTSLFLYNNVELLSSTYKSKQNCSDLIAKSMYPEVLLGLGFNAAVILYCCLLWNAWRLEEQQEGTSTHSGCFNVISASPCRALYSSSWSSGIWQRLFKSVNTWEEFNIRYLKGKIVPVLN
jgi:hypothetical protein